MMRILRAIVIGIALCSVSIVSLSCASDSDSATPENQIVPVTRGDLTVDITAAGNLSLSLTEELAFEIAGTVEEVLVEAGDSVEEGQVLAKLDTSEWEKELAALETDLLQAEINLDNAELALENAEASTYTYITGDVSAMQTTDPKEIDIKELQVELAEKRLEDAEEALAEALEAGPEITAPFDGFITQVNVSGGDEVMKGTVAVQLADPNQFEADILVSEMDIFDVNLGGEAWVEVDAMQGLSLPATVTHISPTATIQSGVVNYQVKVELEPLETYLQELQEQQESMQQSMPDISSGELPEQLQQAIEEGSITQEEAEEMMERMQQAQAGRQGQVLTTVPESFQLREGLTVTVSIIVDERNDVLLVPNSAVLQRGMETYVQVVSPDGVIEERTITTGISDWQYTEVTSGLSEGEQVVVPQGTSTTTTEQGQGPPERMIFPMGGPP